MKTLAMNTRINTYNIIHIRKNLWSTIVNNHTWCFLFVFLSQMITPTVSPPTVGKSSTISLAVCA